MMKDRQYKNFSELQAEIREEFSPMLAVHEVRNIVGCSAAFVARLIREGELEAFDISGRNADLESVDEHSYGLRITPSSLREYLNSTKIK